MLKLRLTTQLLIAAALTAPAALAQQITVYSGGSLAIGTSKQLTAYVPLAVTTVNWSVNGVTGGKLDLWDCFDQRTLSGSGGGACRECSQRASHQHGGQLQVRYGHDHDHPTSGAAVEHLAKLGGGGSFHDFAEWGQLRAEFDGEPWGSTAGDHPGVGNRPESQRHWHGGSDRNEGADHGDEQRARRDDQLFGQPERYRGASGDDQVAPASVGVPVSTTKKFTATVTGSTNTAVTWSVNGSAGPDLPSQRLVHGPGRCAEPS